MNASEMEVLRRFDEAVQAFDRGACVEEATAELTLDLCDGLPDGDLKNAVRSDTREACCFQVAPCD